MAKKDSVPRVFSCPFCSRTTYYPAKEEFEELLRANINPCGTCSKVFEAYPLLGEWLTNVIDTAVSKAILNHECFNKHEADSYNYY